MAEAEGEGRGRLDAGHGGVGVRVQHGGEAEQEQREETGEQQGDESCQVGRGHHRSRSRRRSSRSATGSEESNLPAPAQLLSCLHAATRYPTEPTSYAPVRCRCDAGAAQVGRLSVQVQDSSGLDWFLQKSEHSQHGSISLVPCPSASMAQRLPLPASRARDQDTTVSYLLFASCNVESVTIRCH